MLRETHLSIAEVEKIARQAHQHQVDKVGRPYVEHLEAVARTVKENGGSPAQVAAAWLHDAIEDGCLSEEWLRRAPLSHQTKEIVRAVTRQSGERPENYAQRILATTGALAVKQADIEHNTHPDRIAALDTATQDRLKQKYDRLRRLLGIPFFVMSEDEVRDTQNNIIAAADMVLELRLVHLGETIDHGVVRIGSEEHKLEASTARQLAGIT